MESSLKDIMKEAFHEADRTIEETDRKITNNLAVEINDNPETPSDLTARIAQRAYELYEQRGRKDGFADEDWLQAEREILKDKPNK